MSWNIEINETEKEPRYKIWSTIIDDYITENWMSRKEIIKFLFWNRFSDFMNKFLVDSMTFPNDWFEKDGKRVFDNTASNEYYQLLEDSTKNEELYFEKFIKELDKYNIELCVTDGKFCIKTKDKE